MPPVEGGGRVVGENKAITAKKARFVLIAFVDIVITRELFLCRFTPYTKFEKCRICKQVVHQSGAHYCQG